ncbi:hypothetical protein KJ885_00510 [Patescibacteria group bacterium]|nr:hypothetical protein [Patescibacteria group bacterium]
MEEEIKEPPQNWDDQKKHLFRKYAKASATDWVIQIYRYQNAKNDPSLSKFPPEMIEKTIEVLKYFIEEDLGIEVDVAIDNLKYFKVI